MSVPSEPWYTDVIELMLLEHIPFGVAAAALNHPIDPKEELGHLRRKSFREAFAAAEAKHFSSKGNALLQTKSILAGKMLDDAERLRLLGKFKEATEATEKGAKLLGYLSDSTNVNIFSDISGSEIEKMKEQLRQRRADEAAKPTIN